jgi:hypothetical protein
VELRRAGIGDQMSRGLWHWWGRRGDIFSALVLGPDEYIVRKGTF